MSATVSVNYKEILKNFFKDLYSAEIAEKIDELLQKGYVLDDMVSFLSDGIYEENDFVEHYEEYAVLNKISSRCAHIQSRRDARIIHYI